MAEGRSHPRGEQFSALNAQLAQAVAHFTQLLSSATAFGQSVNEFRALEAQLALTNAAAGGTAETFKQMEAASRSFAFSTTASAVETASALFYLAQAGYSTAQSMNALPAVMVLAQATMQDVAFTSDLIASTLKTYQLASMDATRVANLFAAAQVNSLASLDKLAFSLRQVGPVASSMGQSIETTTAYLAELYNVGLRGEQAGTALRNVMVRLAKPVGAAADVLRKYKIATTDATGRTRDLEDILLDLYKAGLSNSEATDLFGVEALAGGLALVSSVGRGAFEDQRNAITNTNKAFDMAIERLNTLDGSLRLARNAVNDLFIALGESLAPAISTIALGVREAVLWFNELSPATRQSIAVLVGLATTALAVGGALRTISFMFGPIAAGATRFIAAITGSSAALGAFSSAVVTFARFNLLAAFEGVGASVAALVPSIGRAAAALAGLNIVSFSGVLAGIGGVVAALGIGVVGAGLIYAIYRVGSAWIDANRIAAEELAKQKSMILDAANIDPSTVSRADKRSQRRDVAARSAEFLPGMERLSAFAGIAKDAERDQQNLASATASLEFIASGLTDLDVAYHSVMSNRVWNTLGIGTPAAVESVDWGTQESWVSTTINKLQTFIDSRYDTSKLEPLSKELQAKDLELSRYLSQIMSARASGNTKGLDDLLAKQKESQAARDRIADEITAIQNGPTDSPEYRALQSVRTADAKLQSALSSAMSDGNVSGVEAFQIGNLQYTLQQRMADVKNTFDSAQRASIDAWASIASTRDRALAETDEYKRQALEAAFDITSGIVDGSFDVTELVGKDGTDALKQYLSDPAIAAAFSQQLYEAVQSGKTSIRDALIQTLYQLGQDKSTAIPPEMLSFLQQQLSAPVEAIRVAIAASSNDLIMQTAQIRSDMALAAADADDNLAAGITAETFDATLNAVDRLNDMKGTVKDKLTAALGSGWEDIAVTEDMAVAAGVQYEAGMTLGTLLNLDHFMDGAYAAISEGKSSEEIMGQVDASTAQLDALIVAAVNAVLAQIAKNDGDVSTIGPALNGLAAHLKSMLAAVANLSTTEVANAPVVAARSSKYKPPKGGRGGRGAKNTALKLKQEYEKELREVQKSLLEIEKDKLQFDNTIDFTARFSAMIDIDRKEIALKYDQRIEEIKSDMDAANEKFAKQPDHLAKLREGYGKLITQLEQAKQAELNYTASFTYQSKIRNEAIDRQIDAIRDMSMEGTKAGVAIISGIRAGFLLYQKDLKTTVDNVAEATVGVLDGLADAVGAFVTGSEDAMDVLRNAVLNSLNDLIVNATKRVFQNILEGLTGGGISSGLQGAAVGQVAGATGGGGTSGGGGFWGAVSSLFGGGQAAQTPATGAVAAASGIGDSAQLQAVIQAGIAQLQAVLQSFIVQLQALAAQVAAALGTKLPGTDQPGASGTPLAGVMGTSGTTSTAATAGATGTYSSAAGVTGQFSITGLMSGLFQNLSSMLSGLLGSLGSMLSGLFSSLLGGLGGGGFLGLFDSGGNIPSGKWGIAGERRPEIVKGPATVVSRKDTARMFQGSAERASPTVVTTPAPTINNIIVQDQAVVARYLSTTAGRRQIANIVKQTADPTK